jgi:hypothetical protein
MSLLSCANCWHNPLQYDLVGDEVGYCVRHRMVLRKPEATTCGKLLRKDLSLSRANAVQQRHADQFPCDRVVTLHAEAKRHLPVWTSQDASALEADDVRAAVVDYGERDTKIESLAQLNALAQPRGQDSLRAEIAVLALGRGYVRNCVQRGGKWTSGVHLAWWLGRRLTHAPRIDVGDLRREGQLASSGERLDRLLELAGWSVLMLRLLFLDDLAQHEANDPSQRTHDLASLRDLPQRAALATKVLSLTKLQRWMQREAKPAFEAALPHARYDTLAKALHRTPDAA